MVSPDGIATDPEKIKAVTEWPASSSQKEVRTFLGFVGYYRRFCPDYATVAKPLTRLTAKDTPFCWEEDQRRSFKELKQFLTQAPVLAYPDPKQPFILDTDASADGAGAVLSQLQDGQENVIAYYSKTFSPAERNYCVTRRELLATILAIKHYHPYLYGKKFRVRTDHTSLQ